VSKATIPFPERNDTPKRKRRKFGPLVADAKLLAKMLLVGVRSIRTWDASGKLPKPVKIGTRTVWILREIRDWLKAGAPDRATWERVKST
jgi:predicted DNA-binding transcriptional regulator AlpA